MGRVNTHPSQHGTKVPGILCSTPQKPGTRQIDPSTAGTPAWRPQLQKTQVPPALTTAPLPTCLLLSYVLPEYTIHVTAPKIRPNLSTGGSQEVRSVLREEDACGSRSICGGGHLRRWHSATQRRGRMTRHCTQVQRLPESAVGRWAPGTLARGQLEPVGDKYLCIVLYVFNCP